MYTIGICDDSETFCWEIENYILDYCGHAHMEIETLIFSSGEELLKHWETGMHLDLLFLDIELDTMNGITIGDSIRKNLENEHTQIVFVSIRKDYALQLFKIRPLDFLVKPITNEDIKEIMDIYCKLYVKLRPFFEFKSQKKVYRIDLKKIIYMQSSGKVINVVTTEGRHRYYGKLSDCLQQLNTPNFLHVHKSFIVNTNNISEYHASQLIMCDGIVIPISQSKRKKVKEFILNRNIQNR